MQLSPGCLSSSDLDVQAGLGARAALVWVPKQLWSGCLSSSGLGARAALGLGA